MEWLKEISKILSVRTFDCNMSTKWNKNLDPGFIQSSDN